MSISEADLKLEIERLTGEFLRWVHTIRILTTAGAINRHKSLSQGASSSSHNSRNSKYVNPNYAKSQSDNTLKPPNATNFTASKTRARASIKSNIPEDVVIGGVTFQSSGRSLVRKDRECKETHT